MSTPKTYKKLDRLAKVLLVIAILQALNLAFELYKFIGL